MHWIDTGIVPLEKLTDDPGQTEYEKEEAKMLVVSEPSLKDSVARGFVVSHFKPGAVFNITRSTDERLAKWTREAEQKTASAELFKDNELHSLAEELEMMGYTWVCFVTLMNNGNSLGYTNFSKFPSFIEIE